jgi:transposase-like protein
LSHADVVEWLAERGVAVDRATVDRWVQRFLPIFSAAARPHRQPVGMRWRVDETYGRLHGAWVCRYRAIDQDGQVVDAYRSERRSAAAARDFFERGIGETDMSPTRVTTDPSKCCLPALRAVLPAVEHRRSRSLNNGLERDYGHLKQRLTPMRGFKRLASADAFCRGRALVRNLRGGFSSLTRAVPRAFRLATAWPVLARAF